MEILRGEEDNDREFYEGRIEGDEIGLGQLFVGNNPSARRVSRCDDCSNVQMTSDSQGESSRDHTTINRDFLFDLGTFGSNLSGICPSSKIACVAGWS